MKTLIGFKSRFLINIAILFVILSLSNSCTKSSMSDTTSKPGPNEVWIQGRAFNPSSIPITAGTTITWTNKDGIDHTVTSNSGLFDSGHINNNGTFSHLFSTAGTFAYHCSIHTTMTASVIVN
jgi:plastocyanin